MRCSATRGGLGGRWLTKSSHRLVFDRSGRNSQRHPLPPAWAPRTEPAFLPRLSIDGLSERCSFSTSHMALFVKVRHTFGHRWMPFFLPVAASLLYVLVVVLLVPDSFTGKSKGSKDDELSETPATSASAGTDPAARAAARRRPRVGARAAGAVVPQPGPPAAAPAAPPASPDGNE